MNKNNNKALELKQQENTTQTLQAGRLNPLSEELTTKLFMRASAVWGNKFTTHIATKEMFELAKHEWAQALSGLTEEQLEIAFTKARDTLDYPPSPSELKKLALGLVSKSKAFDLAVGKKKYRELLVSFDWTNLSESALRQKFYAAYENYVDNLLGIE